ncbi:g12145 [Coccomyxa viridis]|uniref:G12145 protein n=1 Tax=Coccomyxa viridis TaxID=1274662 RepID=A0ABP1G9L0_9CHLO
MVLQKAFRPSHVQLLRSSIRHHRAPIRPCTLVVSSYAAEAPMSTQSRPVYANFSVYKGKAALSLKIIKPRWSEMKDGGYMLERPGSLMLELAPVSPESSNSMGARNYVWDRKQYFALSPMEIGGVIEAVAEKKAMKELFHDPNKGRPGDDGRISKTLTLQPLGEKGDWFLGLDVKDAANKENSVKLGLPLTGGELHTIKALSEFLIPRLVGWDEVLNVVDV